MLRLCDAEYLAMNFELPVLDSSSRALSVNSLELLYDSPSRSRSDECEDLPFALLRRVPIGLAASPKWSLAELSLLSPLLRPASLPRTEAPLSAELIDFSRLWGGFVPEQRVFHCLKASSEGGRSIKCPAVPQITAYRIYSHTTSILSGMLSLKMMREATGRRICSEMAENLIPFPVIERTQLNVCWK